MNTPLAFYINRGISDRDPRVAILTERHRRNVQNRLLVSTTEEQVSISTTPIQMSVPNLLSNSNETILNVNVQ